MQHFYTPTCYFPSTVLFLNSDQNFLLNCILHFPEDLAYHLFDSPKDVLQFLKNSKGGLKDLNQRCMTEFSRANSGQLLNTDLNLTALHAEIYNAQRFTEVSVIVSDHLDFFIELSNPSIKKILLTTSNNEAHALKALNQGLIDKYLLKQDPFLNRILSDAIKQLQEKYFLELSMLISPIILSSPPICLFDKKFLLFFKELCNSKSIVEYYLTDSSGSFLLLDEDANISFIIIKSEEDIKVHLELARQHGIEEEILDQLFSGNKLPCFWQGNKNRPEWNSWSSFLVPALSLIAEHKYFYSYVHGPVLFDVRQDRITSYHRYLEELDAEDLLL